MKLVMYCKKLFLISLIILLSLFNSVSVAEETDSADIALISMDVQPSSAPGAPFVGTINVINSGNMTSMSRDVTFYLSTDSEISPDDYKTGTVKLSFLKPGESIYREIVGTVPLVLTPGNYTAGAILGPGFNLTPDRDVTNDIITGGLVEIQSSYARPQKWFNEKIADLIFNYSNKERTLRGLPELSRDLSLDAIALEHSSDMAERNFFDHTNPDGETPSDRALRHGYSQKRILADGSVFYGIGENIVKIPVEKNVYGFGEIMGDDPDQIADVAIESFLDSKPHREALLLPLHEKIGVGVAFDGTYYYVTQNFF